MNKKLISVLAAGVLMLAACGSDSDSGTSSASSEPSVTSESGRDSGGGASGAQAEAAANAIEAAKAQGIELDEDCVNALAGQLSDEDAEAIAAAGPDGDADVSPEGEAIGAQLLGCAGNDAVTDLFIEQLEASGQDFDEQCVRDAMEGLDVSELVGDQQASGEVPEELVSAVMGCVDLGS